MSAREITGTALITCAMLEMEAVITISKSDMA